MAIYQEKNKSKLPKSGCSWYYRCYYTDMYGNRKQKQSKMYSTKKDAKDAEMEFLSKIRTSDEVDYNISFEYVYNDWWEYKKKSLKVTTIYNTKLNLDKQILRWFKEYKLHQIKINVISLWENDLNNKNLSEKYKNDIIGYLREILFFAVDNYDFDRKVATRVQKQKISKRKEKSNDEEQNYWTYEEFEYFIKNVNNDLDYLMYNFLYFTGLRLGETIALTWNDVDFKRKKLKINKIFTNKVEGQVFAILDPKTDNSFRTIDLDDKLVGMLKEHRLNEEKIYSFNNDMFMFGNVKYISPTTFARHLNDWIALAKTKRITPHGFRHSHVSLLINLGCDVRDVADRIGDTVQIVEKTYQHLFPEKRSATINKLNNFKK